MDNISDLMNILYWFILLATKYSVCYITIISMLHRIGVISELSTSGTQVLIKLSKSTEYHETFHTAPAFPEYQLPKGSLDLFSP